MSSTVLVVIGLAIYLIMYFTYGKNLQNHLLKADKNAPPPSEKMRDGIDYVPTNKWVLFGHHFASIAGAGPIVGPAMAMAWGWLPALVWVWIGNVFIGAVHDYLALMASVRHDGKSIQWVAGKLMKKRTGTIFEWFVLFVLILVVAAFGAVVGAQFVGNAAVPSAFVFTCLAAIILGRLLYQTKLPFWVSTLIGIILLAGAMWLGYKVPITLTYKTWLLILGVYIVIAASVPVTWLLQPRDYLNSFLLYAGLVIGGIAFLIGFSHIQMPSYTMWSPPVIAGKPSPFWPLIPLIIACGSLSGFHSLVASGTSSKQLDNETNALFVGYGAMFTEGFLSTIVVCAIGGFGFAVFGQYTSQIQGLGIDLNAVQENVTTFGNQYGNIINKVKEIGGAGGIFAKSYGEGVYAILGLPKAAMNLLAAMWVSSFALTTLDTTNRLARYTVMELAEPLKEKASGLYKVLSNRWVASIIPAVLGLWLAWTGQYNLIWPAFSGANQMLASIALLTAAVWVTKYLKSSKAYQWAVIIPALFLWVTVTLALVWYLFMAVPTFGGIAKWAVGIVTVVMLVLNGMLLIDYFGVSKETVPGGATKKA